MPGFAERFAEFARLRSPLCLGLDPSEEVFAAWGLKSDASGLERFCGTVLEAVGDSLPVVKPQAAFFERFGPAGMAQLAQAAAQLRRQNVLSLIDAKRGDVPGTMQGYAAAMLGADSGFCGDAMTVSAYLGFEALRPTFERAAATGAAVFVVVHSSNPEGRALQSARMADGRSVSQTLADAVTTESRLAPGVVGAVVGATLSQEEAGILDRLPGALLLAPGVGAQGATLDAVASRFACARGRVIPSVSRDILMKGPSVAGLRTTIDRYRDQAWAVLG